MDKRIASLQAKKAEADAAADAAAKQAEVQNAIQKLMESGKSLDDILAMLQ